MAKSTSASVKAAKSNVFYDIPLSLIIVADQIRSGIDKESESFKAILESIREKGVLEPVIVTSKDNKYLLISGERRLLACRQLGLPTIPAWVIDGIEARDELLAIQLIKNLQREDLDPIVEANALFAFMKERHSGTDLDGMMNILLLYNRDQNRVENDFVPTVGTITKISGKSINSLHRCFSLLKLPDVIKTAAKEGKIGVSQGYIFAANLDNPGLMETFQSVLETPITNVALENKLASYKKKKRDTSSAKAKPFTGFYQSIKNVRATVEKEKDNLQ